MPRGRKISATAAPELHPMSGAGNNCRPPPQLIIERRGKNDLAVSSQLEKIYRLGSRLRGCR
jgi:hypothetical protein